MSITHCVLFYLIFIWHVDRHNWLWSLPLWESIHLQCHLGCLGMITTCGFFNSIGSFRQRSPFSRIWLPGARSNVTRTCIGQRGTTATTVIVPWIPLNHLCSLEPIWRIWCVDGLILWHPLEWFIYILTTSSKDAKPTSREPIPPSGIC